MVDSIISTGKNICAALTLLLEYPVPKTIEVATLIDIQNRQLPIISNYTSKLLPQNTSIEIKLLEIDGEDKLKISETPNN